jgi:hypothetical protein
VHWRRGYHLDEADGRIVILNLDIGGKEAISKWSEVFKNQEDLFKPLFICPACMSRNTVASSGGKFSRALAVVEKDEKQVRNVKVEQRVYIPSSSSYRVPVRFDSNRIRSVVPGVKPTVARSLYCLPRITSCWK